MGTTAQVKDRMVDIPLQSTHSFIKRCTFMCPNFQAMVDDGLYNPDDLLQRYELHKKYNCYLTYTCSSHVAGFVRGESEEQDMERRSIRKTPGKYKESTGQGLHGFIQPCKH